MQNFVPVEAHIKEHPVWFHRFDVLWTPTVLIFDPGGVERYRMEGYLPNREFRAQLELGLARIAFMELRRLRVHAREAARELKQNYTDSIWAKKASIWL